MRIVIDLQGAQTESRFRGIGRYSLSFVRALLNRRSQHEFWVVLNGRFGESISEIEEALADVLPRYRVRVFETPRGIALRDPENSWAAASSEVIREAFIAELRPDLVLITSLFEGYLDDAVTSIGALDIPQAPTVVVHYDLIPALRPEYITSPEYGEFYDRKLAYLQHADLLLAISDYSRKEAEDFLNFLSDRVVSISAAVEDGFWRPKDGAPVVPEDFSDLGISRPYILCVPGGFDSRKNLESLLSAFAQLPAAVRRDHQLVIGSKASAYAISKLEAAADAAGLGAEEWVLTGHLEDIRFRDLFCGSSLFVFPSKHEGFGLPLLEAMTLGVPCIASSSTSVGEVMGEAEYCFDPENVNAIRDKMDRALQDDEWRDQLSKHARLRAADFSWDKTAQCALSAIEQKFGSKSQNVLGSPRAGPIAREKIAEAIVAFGAGISVGAQKLELIAQSLAVNLKAGRQDTLFLDVTELAKIDGKTGIQRVVRALLLAIDQGHTRGLHVQPIFFDGHRFRCANAFSSLFLGRDLSGDHLIDFGAGDHYLSLDLNVASIEASEPILKEMQRRGVNLNFLVYDVLPLMHPEWWPAGLADGFASWFEVVSRVADRLICISRAARSDVAAQIELNSSNNTWTPKLGWFHLGADIKNTSPSVHLPRDADDFFGRIVNQTTFLMVGTVEPRKGHALALDAFSQLWRDGYDFNLVVIGKKGWLVDDLADRMSACSKNGSTFYWFQGASDEFLERAYLSCSCLLAASEAEGFGLPLIEASFHNLPVLARDIAVFREVAGDAALYFDGSSAEGLIAGVLRWVRQRELNEIPEPADMDAMSWRQSADALLDQLEI